MAKKPKMSAGERRFWDKSYIFGLGFMAGVLVNNALPVADAQEMQEFRARIRDERGQSVIVEQRAPTSWEAKRQLEAIYGRGKVEWVYPKPRSGKEEVWP
jgi:hypothetical protein